MLKFLCVQVYKKCLKKEKTKIGRV